jgi:hypothetical protein
VKTDDDDDDDDSVGGDKNYSACNYSVPLSESLYFWKACYYFTFPDT